MESTTLRLMTAKSTRIGSAARSVAAMSPAQSGDVPGCWVVK